jgi:hypothetical protein
MPPPLALVLALALTIVLTARPVALAARPLVIRQAFLQRPRQRRSEAASVKA